MSDEKYNQELERYIGNPLSDYAVDLRYPDTTYIPTVEETKEAIELMNKIISVIKETMKIV